MEKTLANIKKQENKDKKRLEKIEKAGYKSQNEFLISKGCEKLSKNLKALRKAKGNQEEALKIIQSKEEKKMKKTLFLDEKVKCSNFETQMNYLNSKGHKNKKKNLKFLTLYNGDQEKALIHLSQPENKLSFQEKIKIAGYEKQNQVLVDKGFSNLKKNLHILKLYEGNVEKALDHYNHNKHVKYEHFLKIIEEKGYSKENTLLIEKGYTKLKRNLKLLSKYKGDVAQILANLGKKQEEKLKDLEELCKSQGVLTQFQELCAKGYKPKRVVKVLKFYKWNCDVAIKHLESKKEKHHIFEEQIKELGYCEQNKVLVEKGFRHLKKNLKLLQTHEGNLEKVLEVYGKKTKKGDKIEKKLAKLNISKQFHEIEAKNEKVKPSKIIKALLKYNGDVQEALKHLEKKQLHKEYSVKSWSSNIHVAYLDGNNMLFVEENMRKLYLTHKKKEAESLLSETAKKFALKKQLEKLVLIFDKGDYSPQEEEILLENKKQLNFVVMCAKEFKNSDDALVSLAEKEKNIHSTIFVTADVELRRRLIEKGVKLLMSPKNWFEATKTE